MEREISHGSSCDKQGILPTFCLVPLRGIGAALLEESDQVIEGDVEINGKHDGGCKPKHLKGQNNALLNNSSSLSGTNQTQPDPHRKNSMVFWPVPFQKGREEKWFVTHWYHLNYSCFGSLRSDQGCLYPSPRLQPSWALGTCWTSAPPAPPLSQGTSATKESPPFLGK